MEDYFVPGLSEVVPCHHDVSPGDEGRGHSLIEGDSGHVEIAGPTGHHFGIIFIGVLLEDVRKPARWRQGGVGKYDGRS